MMGDVSDAGGDPGEGLGSREALSALARYARRRVRGNLGRFIEPEDLFQETMLVAWRKLVAGAAVHVQASGPWLVAIARRKARDLERLRRVRALHLGGGGGEGWNAVALEKIEAPPPPPASPHARADAGLPGGDRPDEDPADADPADADLTDGGLAWEAIEGSLDEAERAYLRLRFVEGCTIREIARRVGRSPSTVLWRLGRVMARLRRAHGIETSPSGDVGEGAVGG